MAKKAMKKAPAAAAKKVTEVKKTEEKVEAPVSPKQSPQTTETKPLTKKQKYMQKKLLFKAKKEAAAAKKTEVEEEKADEQMSEGKKEETKEEEKTTEEAAIEVAEAMEVEEEDSAEDSADEQGEVEEGVENNGESVAVSTGTLNENPTLDPYLLKDAEYIKTDPKWRNKQRTLVLSSRGIAGRHRHLMEDLKKMMPHHKSENKFEKNQDLKVLNEVAELSSCNNVVFFEARKHEDLYMYVSRVPFGPCMKFQVLNIHTSQEIKLSGNCLMGSRPLLTFDKPFDNVPHLKLIKEQFIQTFGTPRNHPKSKPFFDHVMSFYYHDHKIWFRHYQIQPLTETDTDDPEKQTLTEVGPRFVLEPIRIMDKSFTGQTLWLNPRYSSPTAKRREMRKMEGSISLGKMEAGEDLKERREEYKQEEDEVMQIFKD